MSVSPLKARFGDWTTVRRDIAWAYEGKPQFLHRTPVNSTPPLEAKGWLLLRGSVTLAWQSRQTAHVTTGQWVFLGEQRYEHHFSDNAEVLSVSFVARWPDNRPLFSHAPPTVFASSKHSPLERAARTLVRLVSRTWPHIHHRPLLSDVEVDMQTYLATSQAVQRFFDAYLRTMSATGLTVSPPHGPDARVANALRLFNNISLSRRFDEVAAAAAPGLSASQLSRLFVAHVGVTPRNYFERRRVEYAREALAYSDTPVKQITFALGFKQQSHFCNWFRRNTGHSPRAYRRLHS